jgi:hypothetical protein
MSLLNSKFDIVSVDNPMALAALAQVLDVPNGMQLGANGTPTAGTIPPGAVVTMDANGKAILATSGDISVAAQTGKKLVFVTLDGNTDYSGSFVQKLTVLHGGFTMVTDQFDGVASSYTPGLAVSFDSGKVKLLSAMGDPTKAQIMGYVGPAGGDAVAGTVQIIVPQGCGL